MARTRTRTLTRIRRITSRRLGQVFLARIRIQGHSGMRTRTGDHSRTRIRDHSRTRCPVADLRRWEKTRISLRLMICRLSELFRRIIRPLGAALGLVVGLVGSGVGVGIRLLRRLSEFESSRVGGGWKEGSCGLLYVFISRRCCRRCCCCRARPFAFILWTLW